MNHHERLTERERIRIHAQTKHEQLKAEAIDILIDSLHTQTRGGATVSFDHDLALKIEKLIIGNMRREKIIALVRTEIHKPRTLAVGEDIDAFGDYVRCHDGDSKSWARR